jgi:hypothetical protein
MSRRPKKDLTKEIAEELDAFDEMLSSLVEILEQKGIMTHEEWEERIKKRIVKNTKLRSYREIQFNEK